MGPKVLDIGFEASVKKKILVIDDDIEIHALMADSFTDEFEIFSAHNGREGICKAEGILPDLILMDIMMPDLSGSETVKQLGANPRTKSIPVIFVSGKDFNLSTVDYLKDEPNVAGFIRKPFRVKELRQVVRDILSRS